ncbi:hypothetical protein Hanom_Chr15g01356211 [Helianthus anomalus]
MLVGYHLFYDWWIHIVVSVVRIVCVMFGFEPMVFLEATSLSIWIEVRFVYIPPSLDPTNSFVICGTYWVRLFIFLIGGSIRNPPSTHPEFHCTGPHPLQTTTPHHLHHIPRPFSSLGSKPHFQT